MRSILQSQIDLAPQVYESEAKYQPQYQRLQAQIQAQSAQDQLKLYGQLQPEYSALEANYMRSQQAAQQKALQEQAPDYLKAFQQASGTYDTNQALQQYGQNKLAQLNANGTNLSPEEQRQIDQQSRAGYAARGTTLGQQANLSEVLNRYQYRQGREQQLLGTGMQLGQYQAQAAAPALQSFYQQPMYAGAFAGQAVGNALQSQQQAGPSLFNPESQTGMGSIYGAYNSQMNLAGAQAQANAASNAGKSGMFGSLGGGLLSAGGMLGGAAILCWVAREVYGKENPAWLMFRDWMLTSAPKWLLATYIAFGEQFAGFIKNKPLLKNMIRRWMDSKIAV